MNVIFSRKGFDSQYGGMASPILPDGRLVPISIPSGHDKTTISDLPYVDVDIAKLISDVSDRRHGPTTKIHLDPWLDRPTQNGAASWLPALGQTGASQSHLCKRGIGPGDIFLFFGWFRETECVAGKWQFARGAPDLHILFGWLEVGEVLATVSERKKILRRHPWTADHPHMANPDWYDSELNTLYIGREQSTYLCACFPGGGRFPKMRPELQLTKPGCSRSIWSLPSWFSPNGRPPLSYHPKPCSWQHDENSVTLRSAAKGQEFVLHGDNYPEVESWAARLIRENA